MCNNLKGKKIEVRYVVRPIEKQVERLINRQVDR